MHAIRLSLAEYINGLLDDLDAGRRTPLAVVCRIAHVLPCLGPDGAAVYASEGMRLMVIGHGLQWRMPR